MSQNTIKILRSHRHDFLNHLQVIMGYIQLGKSEFAINYMKNINKELQSVRSISALEMPEVAVLLFTKKEEALKYGINMEYHINTNLSNTKLNQIDLVRILANLIDNAIYAIKKSLDVTSKQDKLIKVTFDYVNETLFIEVKNTNSVIADINKIFKYGYTTKGSEGSGIGLFTVKHLVNLIYYYCLII